MEGRDLRRSVNLSEQLVSVDSSSHHLRDLLKLREEDDLRLSRRRGEGVTLASVIASEKRDSAGRGRTLLDIIREEQEMHGGGGGGGGVMVDGNSATGINWRSFRERLRLRRAGIAWADDDAAAEPPPAVLPSPISDPELHVPDPTAPAAASTGAQTAAAAEADEGEQQTRVSLMSLLEQTDRQWAGSPSMGRTMGEEEAAADERGEVVVCMCCVCMVRHKGAAFIPCGHTFCRRCSRELWVSRGNCPLCNGHIHEILDIF